MKNEQKRIENELALCEQQVRTTTTRFEQVEKNLKSALDSAGKWAYAYGNAPTPVRAQINDAVFDKIYIDNDGIATSRLRPLFAELLRRSQNEKIRDVLDVSDHPVPNIEKLAASLCPSDPDSVVQQGWGVREIDLVGLAGHLSEDLVWDGGSPVLEGGAPAIGPVVGVVLNPFMLAVGGVDL